MGSDPASAARLGTSTRARLGGSARLPRTARLELRAAAAAMLFAHLVTATVASAQSTHPAVLVASDSERQPLAAPGQTPSGGSPLGASADASVTAGSSPASSLPPDPVGGFIVGLGRNLFWRPVRGLVQIASELGAGAGAAEVGASGQVLAPEQLDAPATMALLQNFADGIETAGQVAMEMIATGGYASSADVESAGLLLTPDRFRQLAPTSARLAQEAATGFDD